jgi:RNA polymerase sigma-70 factor (ECF subfamily)
MLQFQGGDGAAFDRIVAGYQEGVYHFILRTVRDRGRAEDLTQDVFLRVYRSRDRYQPTAGFRTWLFTIASRLALNEIRAVRRRRRVLADAGSRGFPATLPRGAGVENDAGDAFAAVADPGAETPLDRLERDELAAVLERLVGELPPRQRAAVELQRREELSYREMAEALGVSVMALKSLLVRAREALKDGVLKYREGKDRLAKGTP